MIWVLNKTAMKTLCFKTRFSSSEVGEHFFRLNEPVHLAPHEGAPQEAFQRAQLRCIRWHLGRRHVGAGAGGGAGLAEGLQGVVAHHGGQRGPGARR